MILEARELDARSPLVADICVVGAGAAGLAVASRFLAGGGDVLVLESGGPTVDPSLADLNEGEVVGLPHLGLRDGRVRALGGTTRVWPGQCLRLRETDFCERAWVRYSGWPLSLAELEPWYERAEEWLGLPEPHMRGDPWRLFGVARPALDPSCVELAHSVFAPRPDLARLLREPLRRSKRVRVLLGATVTALRAGDGGRRVEELELISGDGIRRKVRARVVVIAAGGIENARLLLVSRLGGELVGRFFQDHPVAVCAEIETPAPAQLQEAFGVFGRGRARLYPKLLLPPHAQEAARSPACLANLVFEPRQDSGVEALLRLVRAVRDRRPPERALAEVARVAAEPGAVASFARRRFGRGLPPVDRPARIALLTIAEQAPDPASRVTLSDRTDPLGVPRVRLDWRVGEPERRAAAALTRAVAAELERLGLARVTPAPWLDGHGWREHVHDTFHHMGTTRMAAATARGVVDPDCRVHGLDNLYVAGSSVFPTGGAANPTLTIVALALRLAEHLRATVAP